MTSVSGRRPAAVCLPLFPPFVYSFINPPFFFYNYGGGGIAYFRAADLLRLLAISSLPGFGILFLFYLPSGV